MEGFALIHYNNRARSLTLTSHVSPPPLPSSSRTFHLLPHTRPILFISSHQFNSSSSSRNPRNKPFRSRVLLLHPTLLARSPPLMSCPQPHTQIIDHLVRPKSSPESCFSCSATTDRAIGDWILQLDSAHEIG